MYSIHKALAIIDHQLKCNVKTFFSIWKAIGPTFARQHLLWDVRVWMNLWWLWGFPSVLGWVWFRWVLAVQGFYQLSGIPNPLSSCSFLNKSLIKTFQGLHCLPFGWHIFWTRLWLSWKVDLSRLKVQMTGPHWELSGSAQKKKWLKSGSWLNSPTWIYSSWDGWII